MKQLGIRLLISVLLVSGIAGQSVRLFVGTAYAGFGGATNYDECVTESMRGVTSDLAAKAIILSCRERFPARGKKKPASRPLSYEELTRLSGRAGLEFADYYTGNIYNGNPNLTVSEITLSITTREEGKEVTREYMHSFDIPPLKTDSFTFQIIIGDKDSPNSWGIVAAKGY
jgi:hypothetical protein